ncbi:DapH/DapD/GlmU-related protein [Rossellomorea marisflavi]|uniref:DapH/DapD/GlmU-related protein n=1 Tax=Rossellomorea marisflavi TaxID=189381 RepID=UPI003D2F4FE8
MKNSYGIGEIVKNSISLLYTKIFYRNARLIRIPIYVRGKKFFHYDKGLTTGYNCRIEIFEVNPAKKSSLTIGLNCKMGDHVHIAVGEKVIIGSNCLFASKIYISDISHGDYSNLESASTPNTPPDERKLVTNPISIGDNVWLGDNVCILPGVNIGSGCVIGANAVVNKDIPDNCIAVGVPAVVIKRFEEESNTWKRVEN